MDEQEQQDIDSNEGLDIDQVEPTPLSSSLSHKKLIIGIVAGGISYFVQERVISNLDANGSAEYLEKKEGLNALNEEWTKIQSELVAAGKSEEDIAQSKADFFEFFGTTLLLSIRLDSSLSDAEKKALLRELANTIPKDALTVIVDKDCVYTEEILPLPDIFKGTTLKFSKSMLYLDWDDPNEKGCSPIRAQADYLLESADSWGGTIFDKSDINEISIDPNTTFTVEGKILVKRGGLFSNEFEHYTLRDSNGIVSVPPFFVFDSDFLEDHSGSHLYKDNEYVGHVVQDISTGVVWIEGSEVPPEVIEANNPKRPTTFEHTLAKRGEFVRRVMFAVDEEKLINYTDTELIKLGLADGVYEYKNEQIIHNFGGRVSVNKDGSNVSIKYEDIPREECYEFYFINDPYVQGFKDTYVDGVLEYYEGGIGSGNFNQRVEEYKQRVCYSGNETVTIEFRGNVDDIKKQADFYRRSEAPRY